MASETPKIKAEIIDQVTREKLTQRLLGLQRNALLIAEECGNLALWMKRQKDPGKIDK